MDPRAQIRQLLRSGQPGMFPILFDLLEEHGWDFELVAFAAELAPRTVPEGRTMATDAAHDLARLLGELAKTDYPRAVEILGQIDAALPERDYRTYPAIVDGINTAWFNFPQRLQRGRRGVETWQDFLERGKVEWSTGETGGDLEPWEDLTDSEGRATRRQWATDFPSDYYERELEREYPGCSFKTVYEAGYEPETLRDSQGLWRPIRDLGLSGEPDCPHLGNDEGDLVTLEQTYYGEHPGKSCALCEGDLGGGHWVIGGTTEPGWVYALDVACDVTLIEIRELSVSSEALYQWEVLFFRDADAEAVDLPYYDSRFETLEEAQEAAESFRQGVPVPEGSDFRLRRLNIQVDVIRL